MRPENAAAVRSWADLWQLWTASTFLRSYLDTAQGAAFLPRDRDELAEPLQGVVDLLGRAQ